MTRVQKAHKDIKDIYNYYGSNFILISLARCIKGSLNQFVLSSKEKYRAKESNVNIFIKELNK